METGNFGRVRDAYIEARQSFPQEVIEYIWQYLNVPSPAVLDLGCGTGIATRQLAERPGASVVGCDMDQQMIEAAQSVQTSNVAYVTAPASDLPFPDRTFDAVTAFSAFHWFKDPQSIREIQRVLKRGGVYFVINKNDLDGFRKDYRKKLNKLIGTPISNPKDNYNPAMILKDHDFKDVTVWTLQSEERFSFDEALLHIQSSSVWSAIPTARKQKALELMKNHITEAMIDGWAIRELEIVVVTGKL